LALLAGVALIGCWYHPSAKSATIDVPLSLPRIREVELSGAEWAVEHRLEAWDHVAFRNNRIVRRLGRVSVCGEVRPEGAASFRRFIETGGDVVFEEDRNDFDQSWATICNG
jgi:hypothetical protein